MTLTKTFVIFNSTLSDMVKRINATLDSTFPPSEAGYLLHDDYLNALDLVDDTKVMLKMEMVVPNYWSGSKQNVNLIRNLMAELSEYAKKCNAVMFHCHRVLEKVYPERMELVSIWPNEQCLMDFLQNERAQKIVSKFNELMSDDDGKGAVECQMYGHSADDAVNAVKNAFVGCTKVINTDVGYILHPLASSNHLQ